MYYNTRMAVCANCGKHSVVGRSQQHGRGIAGKRWKKRAQATPRLFGANIQTATVMVDGMEKKMKLCAKCIKRAKKDGKLARQQVKLVGNLA